MYRWVSYFASIAMLTVTSTTFAEDRPRFIVTPAFEADLGAAADGASGTQSSSAQSARAGIDADIDAVVLMHELHLGDPWVIPAVGGGAGIDAELIGALCDGCELERSADLIGSADARVHAGWLSGFYRETYQRPVQFSDSFWRDETGTIRRTVGLDVPGLVTLDDPLYDAAMLPFGWERRELFRADLSDYLSPSARLGDEHRWRLAMGTGTVFGKDDASAIHFSVMQVNVAQSVVPPARDQGDTGFYPLYVTPDRDSIQAMQLDLSVLDLQFSSSEIGITRLMFGVSVKRPAAVAALSDAELQHAHPKFALGIGQAISRDYVPGLERFGERSPRRNEMGWMVQIEDFHRIDPTGLAIDAGSQLGADVAYGPVAPLTLSASAALVGARRTLISSLRAPEAELIAEVGDWLIMGRLEAQAEWEFHPMLSLTANAWIERSDRSDTSFRAEVVRAIVPLDTTAGAWLGLSFHPL